MSDSLFFLLGTDFNLERSLCLGLNCLKNYKSFPTFSDHILLLELRFFPSKCFQPISQFCRVEETLILTSKNVQLLTNISWDSVYTAHCLLSVKSCILYSLDNFELFVQFVVTFAPVLFSNVAGEDSY